MAIVGTGGSVHIGANKVGEIANWSIDCAADNVDITSFDSEGWKEFLAGLKEWSGSFEGNLKPGDTNGQLAIVNAWLTGVTVALKLKVDATRELSGDALVQFGIEMPVDDKGSFSSDFQGTGALSVSLT